MSAIARLVRFGATTAATLLVLRPSAILASAEPLTPFDADCDPRPTLIPNSDDVPAPRGPRSS